MTTKMTLVPIFENETFLGNVKVWVNGYLYKSSEIYPWIDENEKILDPELYHQAGQIFNKALLATSICNLSTNSIYEIKIRLIRKKVITSNRKIQKAFQMAFEDITEKPKLRISWTKKLLLFGAKVQIVEFLAIKKENAIPF